MLLEVIGLGAIIYVTRNKINTIKDLVPSFDNVFSTVNLLDKEKSRVEKAIADLEFKKGRLGRNKAKLKELAALYKKLETLED